MIYQLANGKVIHLSVEEFLDLTDDEVIELNRSNGGEIEPSPWAGSSILPSKKDIPLEYIDNEDDDSDKHVDVNSLESDEYPELSDFDDLT